ncbi:MAG: carboxypeptidase regulatory-like domain-containing protein [Planctomycetota bacterium]
MKKLSLFAASLAGLMLAGCGGSTSSTTGSNTPAGGAPDGGTPTSAAAAKTPFPEKDATGTVTGMVTLKGTAPKRKLVPIMGDKYCVDAHKDAPAKTEDEIVDGADQGIENVFIYVKKTPSPWSFTVPTAPVQIHQMGCIYTPHVSAAMVGQTINITSEDDTKHNVHFVSPSGTNSEINKDSLKGQTITYVPQSHELGCYFKCDIHNWMHGWVCIESNPLFAVTDKDGKFTLPKLPPGEYEIGVWHETLKASKPMYKVTVPANGTVKLDITLDQD